MLLILLMFCSALLFINIYVGLPRLGEPIYSRLIGIQIGGDVLRIACDVQSHGLQCLLVVIA